MLSTPAGLAETAAAKGTSVAFHLAGDDHDPVLVTEFEPMLHAVEAAQSDSPGLAAQPSEPVEARLLENLTAIEALAGQPRAAAQALASATLGNRDAALARNSLPVIPALPIGALAVLIAQVNAELDLIAPAWPDERFREAAE